jgi:23S rRNA (pseudouridine1915-N3)-methyltransferase
VKIRIISIGKIKADFVKRGEAEYLKRLTASGWKVDRIELDSETVSGNQVAVAQRREAERLLGRIQSTDLLVVLDERGKRFTSASFADWFGQRQRDGTKAIVLAIGGAYGWHEDVYRRANEQLSLSDLTFPYQMARLILIEQIYRASSILQGLPYHKA